MNIRFADPNLVKYLQRPAEKTEEPQVNPVQQKVEVAVTQLPQVEPQLSKSTEMEMDIEPEATTKDHSVEL